MAATQAAEIIFAQKLASNEKPVRSRALLKLRKYISARSGREDGGFSEEELLKIWKGLFYCLWMQDLPLLQEDLSRKISGLLRSFRTVDSQLLFFQTSLQTMKREWNGIDRLRLDKFYQLVRFLFRELFDMLKSHEWESSLLSRFLSLFWDQLLQGSSAAPAGLVLHILELYLTELAAVGAAELTAEQNLTFIEPFCKTMAKTKDRVLLKAVGSSIFVPIVDQVPLAVEDLLREIRETEEEDEKTTGSEEDDVSRPEELQGHTNGSCEAVLQFDYGAVADRLFDVASRSNIPSFNRTKIYKFVKIFRDLSEGVFPQDEVEVVSSDEDEDDDSRRRRKKKKPKQQQGALQRPRAEEPENSEETTQKKKKKRKRRKKRKNGDVSGAEDQQTTETQTEEEKTSGEQTQDTQKKRKRRKKSENNTHTPADTCPMEESVGESPGLTRAEAEPDNTDTALRKRSEEQEQRPQKKKKQKPAMKRNGAAPQPDGDEQTPAKKRRQKTGRKKSGGEEDTTPLNGHQTPEAADPSLPVGSELKMRKKFVLRQRKAPAPLFCKGKISQISPASKRVTFGLKNNKTMEFRKTDRSALVSPVSQPRVAFDPERTPKSGVLKSNAITRRASAADFF